MRGAAFDGHETARGYYGTFDTSFCVVDNLHNDRIEVRKLELFVMIGVTTPTGANQQWERARRCVPVDSPRPVGAPNSIGDRPFILHRIGGISMLDPS